MALCWTRRQSRSPERWRTSSDPAPRERRRPTTGAPFDSWVIAPGLHIARARAARIASTRLELTVQAAKECRPRRHDAGRRSGRSDHRPRRAAFPGQPQGRDWRDLRGARARGDSVDARSLGVRKTGPGRPHVGHERRRRSRSLPRRVRWQGRARRPEHDQRRRREPLDRRVLSVSLRLRLPGQRRRRHRRLRSVALGPGRVAQPRDETRHQPDPRLGARPVHGRRAVGLRGRGRRAPVDGQALDLGRRREQLLSGRNGLPAGRSSGTQSGDTHVLEREAHGGARPLQHADALLPEMAKVRRRTRRRSFRLRAVDLERPVSRRVLQDRRLARLLRDPLRLAPFFLRADLAGRDPQGRRCPGRLRRGRCDETQQCLSTVRAGLAASRTDRIRVLRHGPPASRVEVRIRLPERRNGLGLALAGGPARRQCLLESRRR